MNPEILDRLLSKLSNVRKSGAGYIASCPCTERHNNGDANPSLKINLADDGKILIHCVSQNCRLDDILERLGMQASELFPPSMSQSPGVGTNTTRPRVYASLDTAIRVVARQLSGQCVGRWTYRKKDGTEAFVVARFDTSKGKEFRPFHRVNQGYVCADPPGKLPLYGLPELDQAEQVFVVEGEKCVEAFRGIGLVATCSAHGSKAASKTDWSPLAAKDVVLTPDNDDAGRIYLRDVTNILTGLSEPTIARALELPDIGEGGDIVDWIAKQRTRDSDELRRQVEALAKNARPVILEHSTGEPEGSNHSQLRKSQATILVELVLDSRVELWHNEDDQPYVTVEVAGHHENHAIEGPIFRRWMLRRYFEDTGGAPCRDAMACQRACKTGQWWAGSARPFPRSSEAQLFAPSTLRSRMQGTVGENLLGNCWPVLTRPVVAGLNPPGDRRPP